MNSEQQQQRIMGYFIEEAREHLQTIEQGVLNLQEILGDSESVNELFRAAHSIKGGSAMLGVSSIQHVSHRLEDFFKILKENPDINVDERLKSLLLAGFDPLSELLDELQSNYKISDDLTIETNNRVKPIFAELESYLNQLLPNSAGADTAKVIPQETVAETKDQGSISQESVFQQEVTTKMRDMLQIFRGSDNAESRSQLQIACDYFQEIGNEFDLRNWTTLVTQVKNAIAQPNNTYRVLAPILIRELKEAQDLVLANREAEVAVSSQLQNLLPYRFADPEDDEVSTIFTTASEMVSHDDETIAEPIAESILEAKSGITDLDVDSHIDFIDPDVDIDLFADQNSEDAFDLAAISNSSIDQMDWMDGEYEISDNQHIDGPKVGDSELKSLAVLFENDDIDFDAAWEDVESNETNMANQGFDNMSDSHNEFLDLLDSTESSATRFSKLSHEESTMDQLFGDDFSTDAPATEGVDDALFPEDISDSWQDTNSISEISSDIVAADQLGVDELFAEDFLNDSNDRNDSLDQQFDANLGLDVDDLGLDDLGLDIVEQLDNSEIAAVDVQSEEDAFIDIQDQSESLSSEAYFAELQRQEKAIAIGEIDDQTFTTDESSEPFALTFSEEGMALLEDPFAIDENLDQALLESETDSINEFASNTSSLNIFDELGFDNDEQEKASDFESDFVDFMTDDQAIATNSVDDFSEDAIDNAAVLTDFFVEAALPEITPSISDNQIDNFTDSFNAFEVDNVDNNNDLEDFFASAEDSEIAEFSDVVDNKDNDLDAFTEQVTTDDLDDFFGDSEESELVIDNIQNKIDSQIDIPNTTDTLNDFFDVATDEPSGLESINNTEWEEFGNEFAEESSIANIADVNDNNEFLDFDVSQDDSLDFSELDTDINSGSSPSMTDDFFAQDDANNSELADLFSGVDTPPTTEHESDLANILDDDFADISLQNLEQNQNLEENLEENLDFESDLTTLQEDLRLEENDLTARTTLDNLADFFQGDDNSDDSSLQVSQDMTSDRLADEEPLSFVEFGEFTDENSAEILDSFSSSGQSSEMDDRIEEVELNGIDDNFDFDDLEAMIGGSSHMPNEVDRTAGFNQFNGQNTATANQINSPQNSGYANFDELEALLGDSSDVTMPNLNIASDQPTIATAVLEKPADEFDDLESMLQSAFAKDVGPIKTKAPVRQTSTTRKPKDSTMRVDVKYLDSLNNLVGELVVNRNLLEQDQERLQQFITNLLHQVQLLSDVSQRMRDQYDRSLLEASLTAGRSNRSYSIETASYSNDAGSNSSVSNDFEGIEFDRYNTFHILSQEIIELIVRVRESASDIEFVVGETDQVTRQLGTITTQIQDDLKQSRMVPFAQIADRLPRGIRDRALKSGKQAELEIFGRETLIDKAILESLTDPLTHLVNNAIDHGLEDPHTRQGGGKSGTGRLTVRAYHQGNQTVISISDDGAGISTDKVKKSAVSKGVRSQSDVDRLNDTEVYALLFEPGFSTAAQADEFKGRGVGLDVVKTCLDDIRGVIIVESAVGKGTTFTIRLPLTLSISKAMFCISDRARIAFPVDGFEDMVEVPQSQIVLNEKGQPCLPWRDTLLPFQHLSNLLSYSRHLSRSSIYGKQENDELCIIILRNDINYLALQVDQFLGEYEIVIKQLEGPIPQPAGIAGATVLGDGRVMAIANVLELFDIASGRLRPSASGVTIQPPVKEEVTVDPTVLIVDDSITVRELLSLTFAKVGYRVEQAKDGQDAWEKLRAGLPCDMIFCDIEMPRMDGLELLSRLQKDSRLKEIPVAMLTSRGADRHRQTAVQHGAKGYFTKPYLEEELLSASKRLLAGETLPI